MRGGSSIWGLEGTLSPSACDICYVPTTGPPMALSSPSCWHAQWVARQPGSVSSQVGTPCLHLDRLPLSAVFLLNRISRHEIYNWMCCVLIVHVIHWDLLMITISIKVGQQNIIILTFKMFWPHVYYIIKGLITEHLLIKLVKIWFETLDNGICYVWNLPQISPPWLLVKSLQGSSLTHPNCWIVMKLAVAARKKHEAKIIHNNFLNFFKKM